MGSMIDQAASQPSLATVALNLTMISSCDKLVVMEVRICGATLPDVCLNTQRAGDRDISLQISSHVCVLLSISITEPKFGSRDRSKITETTS